MSLVTTARTIVMIVVEQMEKIMMRKFRISTF